MSKEKSDRVFNEIYTEIVIDSDKSFLNKTIFRIIRRLGFFNSIGEFRKHRPMYRGFFWGDLPVGGAKSLILGSAGPEKVEDNSPARRFVVARDYETPAQNLNVKNVTYTPNGFAWRGWTLDQSISAVSVRSPKRFFKEIPCRPPRQIVEGTIIQAQTPFTFGDWVPEHRNSILAAKQFPSPLILPNWIGNRSYVHKELSELGVDYIVLNDSIHIENVHVLKKKHILNLLLEEDVQVYRSTYRVLDNSPESGNIIYLSRETFSRTVETTGRQYPSRIISKIVKELGGRVVDTNGKDRNYYRQIASEADIVIADHGGAMFNLMEWRPRAVIEIVEDGWWNECFVFLSAACGAMYHGIIRSTGRSENEVRAQIIAHIENAAKQTKQPIVKKISAEQAASF